MSDNDGRRGVRPLPQAGKAKPVGEGPAAEDAVGRAPASRPLPDI